MPGTAATEPGRQSKQTLRSHLPGTGLAFPAGQFRHAAALDEPVSGLYVPSGHGAKVWLALAAPTAAQYPPTAQLLQVLCPGEALNVPIPHAVHCEAPCPGLY